jgi:polysaccharide pyruvyl transferase WcaK-like protein
MHFVIACLSSGVPAVGASYQGKFEGLYDHFGTSDMAKPEAIWSSSAELIRAIEGAADRQLQLREMLTKKLPGVKGLAMRNLGDIGFSG